MLPVFVKKSLQGNKRQFFYAGNCYFTSHRPIFFIGQHSPLTNLKIDQAKMAFITPALTKSFIQQRTTLSKCSTQKPVAQKRYAAKIVTKMGVGEDGLGEDLEFAQNCIDEGCSVESVQDVLTRLERRRAVLTLEVEKIEDIMAILAKENLGGDRSLIGDAMAAAVSIFAKTNDDYPNVGSEGVNSWSLDPLKKQPKL